MRRLNRGDVDVPACLVEFRHGEHTWDDVRAHKAEIHACLEQMQGRRCAYCEGPLDTLGQHVEHFRRKFHFPLLTFVWTNLYWSCDQKDSCGHFKDHGAGAYDVNDLIDPCSDDPDHFFRFRLDGTISVRQGLSASDKRKADETLRVLNLHPKWGRLRNMRKAALSNYVYLVDEASGFAPAELQELFRDELNAARHLPFSTAIRHVLTAA